MLDMKRNGTDETLHLQHFGFLENGFLVATPEIICPQAVL